MNGPRTSSGLSFLPPLSPGAPRFFPDGAAFLDPSRWRFCGPGVVALGRGAWFVFVG